MNKQFRVTINGNTYNVDVEEISGKVAPVQSVEVKAPAQIAVAPQEVVPPAPTPVIEEVKEVVEPKIQSTNADTVKVNAPMPGNVWKILKKPGDKVNKHETILILEVMKMENEIVAPSEGEISAILVSEGEKVNVGQVMVEIQ